MNDNEEEEEDRIMLVFYTDEWYEDELLGQDYGSRKLAKKRSTTDVLLFGATTK